MKDFAVYPVGAEKLCKTAMKGSGRFINPAVNLRFH
jgi:hypothetical protein